MIKEQLEAARRVGPNSLRACEDKWSAFLVPVTHEAVTHEAVNNMPSYAPSGDEGMRFDPGPPLPRAIVVSSQEALNTIQHFLKEK